MMRAIAENITIVAQSPGLKPVEIDVVVTIPTFKRPEHVLETLASVRDQLTSRRFAVIVMDNDAEDLQGVGATKSWFENADVAGLLIIAHDRGNCNAYNAGFRTALEIFPNCASVLVIDDDEIAGPHWLENMCATREKLGVDIVGGPQRPVFAKPEHRHFANHPVFSPHYTMTEIVPILYSSGNMLLGRHVLEAHGHPYLDLKFNFMGGGDADFLDRSVRMGFKLAWCEEAPVFETVPERRTESDWIRARSLRNGVISTLVEKKMRAKERLGGLRTFAKSLALLAVSPFRSVLDSFKSGSVSIGLYPVYISVGRVLAEFGYSNEQYRNPEKN
jgi:glycosyltransferase involved in cell wall biosynthesis